MTTRNEAWLKGTLAQWLCVILAGIITWMAKTTYTNVSQTINSLQAAVIDFNIRIAQVELGVSDIKFNTQELKKDTRELEKNVTQLHIDVRRLTL